MIPTAWSVLFPGDCLPDEALRRVHHSAAMNRLRLGLRGRSDAVFAQTAERSIESALREALAIPLVDPLVSAWRRHPDLTRVLEASPPPSSLVLFGVGEHEVVSIHRPRVEVIDSDGVLASFEFELRLELRVQGASFRIESGAQSACVAVGLCAGSAALELDGEQLATRASEEIPLPAEVPLGASVAPPPVGALPSPTR